MKTAVADPPTGLWQSVSHWLQTKTSWPDQPGVQNLHMEEGRFSPGQSDSEHHEFILHSTIKHWPGAFTSILVCLHPSGLCLQRSPLASISSASTVFKINKQEFYLSLSPLHQMNIKQPIDAQWDPVVLIKSKYSTCGCDTSKSSSAWLYRIKPVGLLDLYWPSGSCVCSSYPFPSRGTLSKPKETRINTNDPK